MCYIHQDDLERGEAQMGQFSEDSSRELNLINILRRRRRERSCSCGKGGGAPLSAWGCHPPTHLLYFIIFVYSGRTRAMQKTFEFFLPPGIAEGHAVMVTGRFSEEPPPPCPKPTFAPKPVPPWCEPDRTCGVASRPRPPRPRPLDSRDLDP